MKKIMLELRVVEILGVAVFLVALVLSQFCGKQWWVSIILLSGAITYFSCAAMRMRLWLRSRKKDRINGGK